MGLALPTELLMLLEDSCPCRSTQLRQLTALYNDLYPPPRNLVVYGLQGTGKLDTVCSVLDARNLTHAVVRSRECLSLRHLLSKIHTACIAALYRGGDKRAEEALERRTDSVNALSVNLQRVLSGRDEKLVLVLDGIDQQRGLNLNTLPALARLSDVISNLCLIFIVTTPRALYLQNAGIPYLHFPPYNRAEAISLVIRSAPQPAPQHHFESYQDLPTLQKWYALFATTVYDSLVSPTSLSISHFQRTCEMLWPRFIWPYLNGEQPPGKGRNAQWDFPKLLVRQRSLFQTAGEETLAARLLPQTHATTFEELQREQERVEESASEKDVGAPSSAPLRPNPILSSVLPAQPPLRASPLLPLFPTLLLTAAYLASHTPPKLDILLFSRLSSSSRSARVKKSYHRRKLFQSPSKTKPTASAADGGYGGGGGGGSTPTPKKQRKPAPRKAGLNMHLNLPRSFTLERLVAIFRAIHPSGVPGSRSLVDRAGSEVAQLAGLRLLVSADAATGGGAMGLGTRALGEEGGEEKRWRVNVPRGFVEELGGRFEDERERVGVGGLLREFELVEG